MVYQGTGGRPGSLSDSSRVSWSAQAARVELLLCVGARHSLSPQDAAHNAQFSQIIRRETQLVRNRRHVFRDRLRITAADSGVITEK
jgi:hypothetical protein